MSAILPTGKRAVAIKIDNDGNSTAGEFICPMTGSMSSVLPATRNPPRLEGSKS